MTREPPIPAEAIELMTRALALIDAAGAGSTGTACRLQHALDDATEASLQHSRGRLCVPAADIVERDYGGRAAFH